MYTTIPKPLDTADHIQDLCSFQTIFNASVGNQEIEDRVREERDLFRERYNSDNHCQSVFYEIGLLTSCHLPSYLRLLPQLSPSRAIPKMWMSALSFAPVNGLEVNISDT